MSAQVVMERVRQISWGSAAVGGLFGLGLTLLFALLVSDAMAKTLAPLGATVVVGLMILVLALLRLVAGMWTAQLVRRRYEVRHRREYLPTALVAGALGWAMYTALILASGGALGSSVDLPRLLLDVLQWLAEFGLGAYLVSPDAPSARSPRGVSGRGPARSR